MVRIWPFGSASRSTVYSIHEPPDNEGTPVERAERLVFIADGFSWLTALFGPAYLAIKRQWIALAIYIALLVTVVNVLRLAGAEAQWISWATLLLNVIFGFEMSDIQRRALARSGWRELGAVSGITAEEAERRFFTAWLPADGGSSAGAGPQAPPTAPPGPAATPHHDAVSRAETLLHKLSSRFTRKSVTGT